MTKNHEKEINFKFHLEPFQIPPNQKRLDFCTKADFELLCAVDAPKKLVEFLWHQYQLHRAVCTIAEVESKFSD